MSTEELQLQDELKKLEIGLVAKPSSSENKSENPFFQDVNKSKSEQFNTLKIFGDPVSKSKCGCRKRQSSESTLDSDIKSRPPSVPVVEYNNTTTTSLAAQSSTIRTILHQRSFKPKKKPVLREPIMKSIQNC